jgi:uncharacterized Ntn-hydrolase superfamily protein
VHRVGRGYVARGDVRAGQQVVDALAAGYEAAPQAGLDGKRWGQSDTLCGRDRVR